MNNIETLKLALEALEKSMYPQKKQFEAITALRQAIEQAQQDVDWEKLYRLEVKKKEAIAAKYEQDIKPLTKIVPMAQQADKQGSPCSEFWDWLPKAYNFEGDGNFTKYNMEVAFLAGKQAQYAEQMELPEPRLTGTFSIRAGKFRCTGCTGSWANKEDAKQHSCKDYQ